MFVKHRCPRRQQSQIMAKISKSYILTLPHPQGHMMSVECEEPIDELTVQVWLLFDHPNFKYCTLFVSGTELRTDGQTDRQTNGRIDRRTIQLLDAPTDLSGRGHKNQIGLVLSASSKMYNVCLVSVMGVHGRDFSTDEAGYFWFFFKLHKSLNFKCRRISIENVSKD